MPRNPEFLHCYAANIGYFNNMVSSWWQFPTSMADMFISIIRWPRNWNGKDDKQGIFNARLGLVSPELLLSSTIKRLDAYPSNFDHLVFIPSSNVKVACIVIVRL